MADVTLVEALTTLQRAQRLDAANLDIVPVTADTTKARRAGTDAAGLMALGRTEEAMALVMAQPPGAIQAAKAQARVELLTKMSTSTTYSPAQRALAARALKSESTNSRTARKGI